MELGVELRRKWELSDIFFVTDAMTTCDLKSTSCFILLGAIVVYDERYRKSLCKDCKVMSYLILPWIYALPELTRTWARTHTIGILAGLYSYRAMYAIFLKTTHEKLASLRSNGM